MQSLQFPTWQAFVEKFRKIKKVAVTMNNISALTETNIAFDEAFTSNLRRQYFRCFRVIYILVEMI